MIDSNVFSSSSSWQEEDEEKKWRWITVGPGTRRGHEYFCSLKARAVMTENQRKTSYLCYRLIATTREMIQFIVTSPDTSHVFLMTFIIRTSILYGTCFWRFLSLPRSQILIYHHSHFQQKLTLLQHKANVATTGTPSTSLSSPYIINLEELFYAGCSLCS